MLLGGGVLGNNDVWSGEKRVPFGRLLRLFLSCWSGGCDRPRLLVQPLPAARGSCSSRELQCARRGRTEEQLLAGTAAFSAICGCSSCPYRILSAVSGETFRTELAECQICSQGDVLPKVFSFLCHVIGFSHSSEACRFQAANSPLLLRASTLALCFVLFQSPACSAVFLLKLEAFRAKSCLPACLYSSQSSGCLMLLGSTNSISKGGGSVNSQPRVLSGLSARPAVTRSPAATPGEGAGPTAPARTGEAEAGEKRGGMGCRPPRQRDLGVTFAVLVLGRGEGWAGESRAGGKEEAAGGCAE